jgi:uncharacterized protein YyaL (SSP411 family)
MRYLLILIFAIFAAAEHNYTNELIYEESPYLRQHAHNPVQWLPWGEKAFEKAKREHKPIFLSIGYSTCHWCHVMERESFENEEIAKLINENFVPVKVDREERPDLDRYFQTVYAVMHQRSGGWPLTVILTEEGKPFFSATYIPPEDGYGVRGLKTILPILAKAYKLERDYIEKRAESIEKLAREALEARYVPVHLDPALLKKAVEQIRKRYDPIHGGFSKKIKFPQPSTLELLLDAYELAGDKEALEMAVTTLRKMAEGGIFDQIEGGFYRYTTDRKWSMPHFEKMLYTNAELIGVYTHAYKITKAPLFANIVRRTIANVEERFGHKGLYFGASDAESEDEEGGYFLIDYAGALEFLRKNGIGERRAKEALKALGIEEEGTFDSHLSNPAKKGEVDGEILKLLRKYRQKRHPYPFIDKKIITAWNALYIANKLRASLIDRRYEKEALASLDVLSKRLLDERLYHQRLADEKPTKPAFLEDYAFFIDALVEGFVHSQDSRYLAQARRLYESAKREFFKEGRWYFGLQDKKVAARLDDGYYASPYATLHQALLKLADLEYDTKLRESVKKQIDEVSALIHNEPGSYPSLTRLYLRYIYGDVVVKGPKQRLLNDLPCILSLPYPYILAKAEDLKEYEACTFELCFATGDLEAIEKAVKKRIGR